MKVHLCRLVALLFVVQISLQQDLNCYVPADIMILIDGSDSIQDGDWLQVKSFVRQLVTNFDVGKDAINVGFVVYSSDIGDHIGLKPFRTKQLLQTISGILKHPKASTNTAKGIEFVRKEFKDRGRPNVPKILIVITDGSSDNPRETRLQANLAKMEGTRVIAVGVGQTFKDELRQVASKPENVYTAASYASLRTLVSEIRRMVCTVITTTTTTTTAIPIPTDPPVTIPVPTGKICNVPADIVFVVDGSQSIADTDFVKLKSFVANLIDNFEIAPEATHIGVVTYSTVIGDTVSLKPFKNKNLLKILTRNLRHAKDGTNTAKGIERAREMIRDEGIRSDSPKIIVVITDGRSISPLKTKAQADMARASGVTMIAVGVGTQIYKDELRSIGGSKVFEVSDFQSLQLFVTAMRDLICQVRVTITTPTPEPPTTPPPYVPPPEGLICDVPADIGFLLDGSDSIAARDWTKQKNFVANLINNLDIGRDTIHAGIVVFSTIIGETVNLTPFKPKALLQIMVRNLKQPKVGTNTARGIKKMTEMLNSQGRSKAPKVMIIVTDGKSSAPRDTINEANLAKQQGITVIAVGVGSQIFMNELRQIATNERKLFEVTDFSSLQQIIVALRDLICQVITTTPVIVTTTPMPQPSTLPPIAGCDVPADIMMLMHGSKDMGESNWDYNKRFVSSLVRNLQVRRRAHHVGMIVYSMSIGDHIGLKPFKETFALENLANSLLHPGAGANTAAAIAKLREAYRDHGRPGAPKIGVIITDETSNLPEETQVQADLAKTEGVKLITIGVGSRTNPAELNNLATDARKVYQVNGFSEIGNIMPQVREMICEIITTPTRPTHNFTELCAGCLVESQTGFNPYPGDCSKFVQCWKDFGEIRGVIKDCPFGQFWDRQALACRPSLNVQCPEDPCNSSPDGFTYGMTKYGCRSYWVCLNGFSVGSCCPEGTYYIEGMGCMRGMACKTSCPPDGGLVVSPNCQKNVHWDERKYIQSMPNIGPVVRHCAPGTVFDKGYCSCVIGTSFYVAVTPQDKCSSTGHFTFDVDLRDKSGQQTAVGYKNVQRTQRGTAHFNGNSQMNLWRLTGMNLQNKLVVKFKFKFDRWNSKFDYGGHVVDVDWTGNFKWKWDKEFGWRRNNTVGGGWDIFTLVKMFRNLYASTSERQMERQMLKIAQSPDFQMLLYHLGFLPDSTNAMQILRMLMSGEGSVFIRDILNRIGDRQGAYEIRILLQQLLNMQGINKWIRDGSGEHVDITMDMWTRFLRTLNISDDRWSDDYGWMKTMDDNSLSTIARNWWNFVREYGLTGPEWQNILRWSLGPSGENGHLDKRWITEMLIVMKNDTLKDNWLNYLNGRNMSIVWDNNGWKVKIGVTNPNGQNGWTKWLNWLLRIYYKGSGTDTAGGGNDWMNIDNNSLDSIAKLWWHFIRENGLTGPEWQQILQWSLGTDGSNGHVDKRWVNEMMILMKYDNYKRKWLNFLNKQNMSVVWDNGWKIQVGITNPNGQNGWSLWLNWMIRIYNRIGGVIDGSGTDVGSDEWLYWYLLSGLANGWEGAEGMDWGTGMGGNGLGWNWGSGSGQGGWNWGSGSGQGGWDWGSGSGQGGWDWGTGGQGGWNWGSGTGEQNKWNWGSGSNGKGGLNSGSGTAGQNGWNMGSGADGQGGWNIGSGAGGQDGWNMGAGFSGQGGLNMGSGTSGQDGWNMGSGGQGGWTLGSGGQGEWGFGVDGKWGSATGNQGGWNLGSGLDGQGGWSWSGGMHGGGQNGGNVDGKGGVLTNGIVNENAGIGMSTSQGVSGIDLMNFLIGGGGTDLGGVGIANAGGLDWGLKHTLKDVNHSSSGLTGSQSAAGNLSALLNSLAGGSYIGTGSGTYVGQNSNAGNNNAGNGKTGNGKTGSDHAGNGHAGNGHAGNGMTGNDNSGKGHIDSTGNGFVGKGFIRTSAGKGHVGSAGNINVGNGHVGSVGNRQIGGSGWNARGTGLASLGGSLSGGGGIVNRGGKDWYNELGLGTGINGWVAGQGSISGGGYNPGGKNWQQTSGSSGTKPNGIFGGAFGSFSSSGGFSSGSTSTGGSSSSGGQSTGGSSSHEGLETILSNLGGVVNGQGSSSSSSNEYGGSSGSVGFFPAGLSDSDILDGLLIGSGEVYRRKREANARHRRAAPGDVYQYQTLVSNCQPGGQQGPSVHISANERNVRFMLKTAGSNKAAKMEIPTVPGWNEVTLVYDGKNMKGGVKNWRGTKNKKKTLTGNIESKPGGLIVGACPGGVNFKGEMDDLMIFNCLPQKFKNKPPK